MPEHNNYRFVTFKAQITLLVPWDTAGNPREVAAFWREQNLQTFTNPDAMNVFNVAPIGSARTVNHASELPR